ncbi:MAG TPA: GspH/FimT family pseudopilin [Tepidisphaeraceae bacterium]|jgi:prepilin-type N-terminal cleavage/methylation domain-containing protein|nr:GspH/FimT family pseudopilin [Tepidisphaeraceae bacterium]
MRTIRKSSSAFTLMELVIVMMILTIAAMIGLPRFSTAICRYKAELAARQILADLNLARATAKSTSASQTVAFNVAASSYTMAGIQSLDDHSPNYQLSLAAHPYDSTLISVNFNGTSQVTFDAYGSADNGGKITLACGGIQTTVTLEATNGKATVP